MREREKTWLVHGCIVQEPRGGDEGFSEGPEVDLAKVRAAQHDSAEPIFSAEFISVPELLRRIRNGKDEHGAVYRMGVSLADLMLFFATHPEYFTAEE